METAQLHDLIAHYDVPVPRYTSYPTVPNWNTGAPDVARWITSVSNSGTIEPQKGLQLYLHLPFCESLCTYCACNTRITRNHAVEAPYLQALLKEWATVRSWLPSTPVIREIHLGGGTPTFFSPENLQYLIQHLLQNTIAPEAQEFSFEGHPNNTTYAHLQVLANLGFRRVSFGVQDLNLKVQQAIHRLQPLENLERVTSQARELGYTSISYDLVYGLPFQTLSTMSETLAAVIRLKPDRIAFYSYAHVPWIKPGQRGYEDSDLPEAAAKRQLFEIGRARLLEAGYLEIGMDHFALPEDSLAKAMEAGMLHRNFMGYTTQSTPLLIGLGASAISESMDGYAQNAKTVEGYQQQVMENGNGLFRSHFLTGEDRIRKKIILDIACRGIITPKALVWLEAHQLAAWNAIRNQGLVAGDGLYRLTETGRIFLRNICALFDQYYHPNTSKSVFSKAI